MSQAFDRSHIDVAHSYSGAPLHMPTLTGAGMKVLYEKPLLTAYLSDPDAAAVAAATAAVGVTRSAGEAGRV